MATKGALRRPFGIRALLVFGWGIFPAALNVCIARLGQCVLAQAADWAIWLGGGLLIAGWH